MAKKLDVKKAAALSTAIVTGAKVAFEAWDALNKDGRVSDAVKGLGDKLRETTRMRSPQARLLKQLDLIDEYALKAAGDPTAADEATRWLKESTAIREKLPLVEALPGRDGQRKLRHLRQRTTDLLTEVITSGFGPDLPQD
ncbi:hypothetical protein [Aestuariimicrobium sp. Y1814]|uniref:hypothetical protein n=1 Tax=Aestuariimicrobium sp. Y1814 TaxID=3418742 RepID=UPI003DA79B3E